METQNNIGDLIRKLQTNYTTGSTKISEHVDFSLSDTINTIDAYINSKHTSGLYDSLGREKPFFNIVTSAINIWYRATDIDRKDIKIRATKSRDIMKSFIATVLLQDYMRKTDFGSFLNKWGKSLARYGSTVLKFVEKDGELIPNVISWNNIIIDPIDFANNPKIEKLSLTPAQLKQNTSYDQKVVDSLIDSLQTRKTLRRQQQDNLSDYIELYEIHGVLPLSYKTGNEKDDHTYVQQMHVVSFIAGNDGKYDDFTLVKGLEDKDPYMITHLIEEDGRSLSIGAVEHLFQAQWMQNHTVKSIKDQLDLASKLIYQTSDESFIGMNALSAIENGDILIHTVNQPLTQVNNSSHDTVSLQNFGTQWKQLAQEITSTPDSIAGNTMPSGTAYRQVAILNQESHSLFEIMTENKGLHLENMLRKFIIPFLKKRLNHKEEILSILESHDIAKIDSAFISYTAVNEFNNNIKKSLLKGDIPTGTVEEEINKVQEQLSKMGNQRFFTPDEIGDATWKEILKDLEWDIEVDITGENINKEAIMTTLTTLLQSVAQNPNILIDPTMKTLFNKIIEQTGAISPIEIPNTPPPQQLPEQQVPAPTQPQMAT